MGVKSDSLSHYPEDRAIAVEAGALRLRLRVSIAIQELHGHSQRSKPTARQGIQQSWWVRERALEGNHGSSKVVQRNPPAPVKTRLSTPSIPRVLRPVLELESHLFTSTLFEQEVCYVNNRPVKLCGGWDPIGGTRGRLCWSGWANDSPPSKNEIPGSKPVPLA